MKVVIGLITSLFAAFALIGNAGESVRIRPEGHLKEFLSRQVSGLTGHRQAMGYPFDGCMWAGSISNVYFEEDLPYSRKVAAPRDEIWWPYEQAAYLLDGMMRLSRLVDAPELRSDFKRNLDWCIDHQASDGDLFAAYSKSTCQWPMVVFFRAALAYVEETDDARVKEAFIRHYAAKRNAPQDTDDRDVLNVEGMLKVAEWTGDRSYVTAAEDWFRKHHYCERFANTDRVHSHGVTFCEMLKLPMLLYRATGKDEWRELGIKAMRDVFRRNETPNGQVSACEYLSGRDPWEGSETCDAADMMCALSHFLDDPEAGCEAADHMERIAYNALPGAMTKDFTAHQYISLPNQAVATPFSHGGHFFYGEPDWNRFRVCHFAQCCSGNINRAMPLFVENSWREVKRKGEKGKSADILPSSMLLGPGRVNGDGFEIACETDYPFGDKLVYRFKTVDAASSPRQKMIFSFRIPSWVASATVAKNGTPMNLAVKPGTLAKIEDAWKDGDTLEVNFEQPVTFHSDRHWHWLRRGALTLAHPVKTRCVREKPGAKFSDLSFEDPEPFNYAFDLKAMANAKLETAFAGSDYPFETPNLVVKVPMWEIREWRGLSEQRFTPPVPLYTHETGRMVTLDFVPYATTLTRITAFPDTVKRTALPVVRVYAAPECYDYDPKKPLAEQRGEPEDWTDEEFCDKGADVQRSPDLWTDCEAQYLANKGKFAYLLFRFWSERESPVTCALGASRCVQAFVGGKEVYANGPIVEGRMVAPFWFSLNAKKGYNFLKVKVATNGKEKVFGQDQYRREWGAKLEVWASEPQEIDLQRQIDDFANRGGGRVVVPAGSWMSRPIVLKSGVTLALERGAILYASTNSADYGSVAGARVFIYAERADGVAIEGPGTISGRGGVFHETTAKLDGAAQPQLLPVLIRLSCCRNVRLEDFSFREAAAWGCHLRNCDGVVVRGVRAFSHVNGTNDGLDIESRNVLVENCDIDTDDDAIVFKSESNPDFPVENVVVRNCHVASCCNGIKFGTGSYGDFRNIQIENCTLSRARENYRFHWNRDAAKNRRIPGVTNEVSGLSALALEVVDGGRMENVTIRDIRIREGFNVPLFVRLGRRHAPRGGQESYLRNVLIENVTGVGESLISSSITGVPGLCPSEITLRNVDLTFPGGAATAVDPGTVPEKEDGYPECIMFDYGILPASCLFVRHARGIRFDNVRIRTVCADARPSCVFIDAETTGEPLVSRRRTISLTGDGWTLNGVPVSVPHTWNAVDGADGRGPDCENSAAACSYLRTKSTYCRSLPDPTPDRRTFIRFGGASVIAEVKVNGHTVGVHDGAYTAFAFEITPFLNPKGNRLEVAVDNRLDGQNTTPPISADYTVYGGLYRSVDLIETDRACIDPRQSRDGLSVVTDLDSGAVRVQTWLDGTTPKARLAFEIRDADGKVVVRAENAEFCVPKPKPWSPETPNLYTLIARLSDGASEDEIVRRFGFRKVELREDGFYLNGVRRKLKGVNRHQDREGKGWAISRSDEAEDIAWIKRMGADAVRTAHYPQSQSFYDFCDQVGLMAWVEYPNVDAVNDAPDYMKRATEGIREMVMGLKDHPSIVIWGVANEIDAKFMEKKGLGHVSAKNVVSGLVQAARACDTSRPVGLVSCDRKSAAVNGVADMLGFNLYPGWYALEADEMDKDLDLVFAANPQRRWAFVTEYGAGGAVANHADLRRRNQPLDAFHSEEYQAYVHACNYRQLQADSRVGGTFAWVMFDFGADARREGARFGRNDKGLVTFDHKTAKDAFYFYKANWNSEPALHLVGSRMRTRASGPATVMGFSNLGETVLKVNGREIGRQMPDAVKTVCWNAVPLDVGENVIELVSGNRSVRAIWTVVTGKETGK